jgi:hypothetical protein
VAQQEFDALVLLVFDNRRQCEWNFYSKGVYATW